MRPAAPDDRPERRGRQAARGGKADSVLLGVIGAGALAFLAGRYLPDAVSRPVAGALFFAVFALVATAKWLVRMQPFEVRWAPTVLLWVALYVVHALAWFVGSGGT